MKPELQAITVPIELDPVSLESVTGRMRQAMNTLDGDGCECAACMSRYFPKALQRSRDLYGESDEA